MIETGILYVYYIIVIMTALLIIKSINPLHSLLFLILTFLHTFALIFLLNLDFFAFILIIVYIGAIAVLFMFVVMLLNINIIELEDQFFNYIPLGSVLGIIYIIDIIMIYKESTEAPWENYKLLTTNWINYIQPAGELIEVLGSNLFNFNYLFLLYAAIILLIAMIGSIFLVLTPPKATSH